MWLFFLLLVVCIYTPIWMLVWSLFGLLQNQKTCSCSSPSVVWLNWSAFHEKDFFLLFCFSSHLILACFYLVLCSFFWFYLFSPIFCKVREIPKNFLSSFSLLFSSVIMLFTKGYVILHSWPLSSSEF